MDKELVANRLSDWLRQEGMSQGELAVRASLSPTTVSRLMNARIERPRRNTIYEIARALGLESVEGFLMGPGVLAGGPLGDVRRDPGIAMLLAEDEQYAREVEGWDAAESERRLYLVTEAGERISAARPGANPEIKAALDHLGRRFGRRFALLYRHKERRLEAEQLAIIEREGDVESALERARGLAEVNEQPLF